MRLGIFVTHPIQYFAPLWRAIAATGEIELKVYFFSDHSVRGGVDRGFNVPVAWDTPILEGYNHEFLSRSADLDRPREVAIADPDAVLAKDRLDAVMVHGYTHAFERQIVTRGRRTKRRVILRGELSDVEPYGGRGLFRSAARDLYLRWFYSNIDAFCYVGTEAKLHLARRGVPYDRMYFSPYSVDSAMFERMRAETPRAEARAKLGVPDPDRTRVVLFSGKLIDRKSPLLLIEAMARLPDPERYFLLIVGDGEQRALVERAASASLSDRYRLAGFVNQTELGPYFAAADVFVLPSKFETWGLVVNEAMHFGLPVIASDGVGARRDLIEPGITGMVFRSGDAADLSSAIASIFTDPERARGMGEAAAKRVRAYSIERSAEGVIAAALGRPSA